MYLVFLTAGTPTTTSPSTGPFNDYEDVAANASDSESKANASCNMTTECKIWNYEIVDERDDKQVRTVENSEDDTDSYISGGSYETPENGKSNEMRQ